MPPTKRSPLAADPYQQHIDQSLRYIQDHLADPLDLETLACQAGFSPFHFHRVFSAATGENPQDFVNRLRLERAANLLVKSPSLPITQVALTCGFSSSSAFARSFKKWFGIPARDYARQNAGCPPAWVSLRPDLPNQPAYQLPDVQVRRMPALHLAYFAARQGYARESVQEVWGRLFRWAGARQLLTPRTQLVAVSFDDPAITPPHQCRYYACITVPESLTRDARAGFLDYPEHLCAVVRMDCDAVEIQPAYMALYREWLPGSGFLLADLPPYDLYYNAPDVDPKSKYVFDLCIPLEE